MKRTSYFLTMILFLVIQCSSNHMVVECLVRTSATTSGNETDHAALIALKASLVGADSGSGSPALSSWNASFHFCKWVGVTCEGRHQRVAALDLSGHDTGGFISPSIGNLSFLRTIDLSGNNLKGFVPKEIGLLSRLEVFNVSRNALQGGFPLQLINCTRLLTIEFNSNQLTGTIPDQLGSMPNLQKFSLVANNFTGEIPTSLGNISSLTQLTLASNSLQGGIPTNLGKLRSLTFLSLQMNYLSGEIPFSLYNLTSLTVLSLVDNQLSGTIAQNMGVHFPRLRLALFGVNNLTGLIPPTLTNISSLQMFFADRNHLYGNVPEGLGRLENFTKLGINGNNLGSGSKGDLDFITSLTNLSGLEHVAIDNNLFGGTLPNSIANLSAKTETLFFGVNKISGHIPAEIGNLVGLTLLGLEYNNITGEIPSSVGNLVMLRKLALGGNKLQGKIPSSMGNLTNLYGLGLEDNQLEGSIPLTLQHCSSMQTLSLADNRLSGTVPTEIISSLDQLIRLFLSNNFFTGYFPVEVGGLMHLNVLYIAQNKFSGKIPAELGRCSMLEFLRAEGNLFLGEIPISLGSLKAARYMDLSANNLSGRIPTELQDLRSLRILDLSFNQLEGEVPRKGIFSNLSRFSVEGNEKLCGGIPELRLPNCSSTNHVKNENRRGISTRIIVAMTVSIFFGFVLVSILTWVVCRKVSKMNVAPNISLVEGGSHLRPLPLSYKQLRDATDGFSVANIIGVGSFGSVYSGALGDKPIAVKVMNLGKRGAIKSFKAECKVLSTIRHRNLLQILSCCLSLDFKGDDFMALVYELMPNGSLDNWLHGSRTLKLGQRLDIAIDIASALEYLHHDCETQIVHCDLKPSNVLLDADMVAHVGDFGLVKILRGASSENFSQEQSVNSLAIKGTVGYVPPEYGMGANVSVQGDMYSYGILLLEMVTGRRPTDETFKDNTSLHKFCKSEAANSNIFDIIDPHLLAELNSESDKCGKNHEDKRVKRVQDCSAAIIKVGVACSVDSPNERMNIREAFKVLRNIKDKLLESF
uniref:non-specific serine/threonine protein kinase n=2 Tax=Kalanchoe fedtschenkoi TaxID=63787 RepID=A0A7N0TAL3_KALFE